MNPNPPCVKRPDRAGFALFEVMLGVLIFSVGILALGAAVNNCLAAQIARADDQRARLALENRMAEIESGAVIIQAGPEPVPENLEGMFSGIKIIQRLEPLEAVNEEDEKIVGISIVTVEASWMSGREPQSKAITFYMLAQAGGRRIQ